MKKIYIILFTIILFFCTAPAVKASECRLFKNGDVISYGLMARGQSIIAGIRTDGKILKVVDADSCQEIGQVRFTGTKYRRPHQFQAANLWKKSGHNGGSPEFAVTDRFQKKKMRLMVYTLDKKMRLGPVVSKTVPIGLHGHKLALRDKIISVKNKKYNIISWEGEKQLLRRKNNLKFLNIADQGHQSAQKNAVAKAMGKIARSQNGTEFVSTNGDNFYPPHTVQSVDDPDFRTNFTVPYDQPGLKVPFWISLGNHDYDNNSVSALLALGARGKKWTMPAKYYSFTYPKNSSRPLLEYFFLDTNAVIGHWSGYKQQLDWLDQGLKKSRARWKIVTGHHQIYSSGFYGNNAEMVKRVLPILNKNKADLYLSGHEHDLELLVVPGDHPVFAVSGAASLTRPVHKGPDSRFAASTLGFASVQIVNKKLAIRFFNRQSELLYEYLLEK
ncbi:metallophosphoesterase [Patescibacteria group bacterium]|nr:metallophosphoesterase [Patescibacteria group bacterium]MBU1673523.1 metallophosphoesterase [Patescibacteria group bacterium]MBU1963707.1 metallophosphoesterase [Patescibacteria group bacterium]